MTNQNDAFNFGKTTYNKGQEIHLNPFKDGTTESEDFVKGWKSAHKATSAAADRNYRSAKRCSPNFHK